jgi:tRNA (cytidine/uridine-2'-O-)-methyltransferase
MPSIVLYQPEIPPNTGNIIRLCANADVDLHLIHPLGFTVEDKQLKRAGLDYHEWARVQHHESYAHFLEANPTRRILACSVRGSKTHTELEYQADDLLLFGPETQGLPKTLLEKMPPEQIIRIPMQPASRSLNLSNAVAIILYEALRQIGFDALNLK